MTGRPLRVLLSAYACEPEKGSEPGIGWNHALQLARYHEVWVITRANNRESIEEALETVPEPRLHPVYHDLPRWMRWWKKGGRGVQVYYYLWQLSLFFVVRRLAGRVDFDVTHHITFGRYWVPSMLPVLRRPFVWGPVGGGDSVPESFRESLSRHGRLRNAARDFARLAASLDPLLRYCARRSTLALAATPATERCLKRLGARNVELMPAVGLSTADIQQLAACPEAGGQIVRFASIGHLLHWKGFEYGLRAFARAGLEDSEYVVIGDGPEMTRLTSVATDLGVRDRVRFLGWVPRSQVLSELSRCHALVHPSLHDSGGWVCLEAMAAGRPVLCLELGGPAVLVEQGTGFVLRADSPAVAVARLADAMRTVAFDEDRRKDMAAAGRSLVSEKYAWDHRGRLMAAAYRTHVPGAVRE